jgi:meiotic recombination protein REC8, fungi type
MLSGDELDILPPGEPFPKRGRLPDPDYRVDNHEAALRPKRRANKALERDEQQELLNADLAKWNNEYSHNMLVARKQKRQHRLPMQAKKNAILWVFNQGIGSVGLGVGSSRLTHPLHCFSGEQLLDTLCTREARSAGRKRSHNVHERESSEENQHIQKRAKRQDGGNDHNNGDVVFADADAAIQDVSDVLIPSDLCCFALFHLRSKWP